MEAAASGAALPAPGAMRPGHAARFEPLPAGLASWRRPPAGRRPRLRPIGLYAGVAGALAFALLVSMGGGSRDTPWSPPSLDELAARAGLGIDQVSVSGYRFTADADILDALDLVHVRSQVGLDVRAVRERIERLPWVRTAAITRELPDRLDIRVLERTPYAVWSVGGRDILVDDTGRRLGPVPAGAFEHLPRIAGLGAGEEAHRLFTLLEGFPDVAARLTLAERVGERRWSLTLSGATVVHLPADGIELALAELVSGAPGHRLLERRVAMVDLRAPGRVVLRARPSP